jgi:HSP20 family protein
MEDLFGLIFSRQIKKSIVMSNIIKRNKDFPSFGFLNPENFFPFDFGNSAREFPAVNICEDDKNYSVDVVAPGFKKGDFKVNLENDVLTISAESKTESDTEDERKQYSRREYGYRSFTRSFTLPDDTEEDNITANYEDGILKLNIPKSVQQEKATKKIEVS